MASPEAARKPVEVTFGKPFRVSPRFGQIQEEYDGGETLLDTILLNIQGGGIGRIQVLHDPGDFGEDSNIPIRVPTGEIRATCTYSDEGVNLADPKKGPVELYIEIARLSRQVLESLRFEIVFEDRTFRANLFFDGMDDKDTGEIIEAVHGLSYTDIRDQTKCWLVLPRDPKIFRRLYMTLSTDQNTHGVIPT